MWRTTTRRLLFAMFWVGVAFAAIKFETREPYGIAAAGLALTFAAMILLEGSGTIRTERAWYVLVLSVLLGSMIVIGGIFAALGR